MTCLVYWAHLPEHRDILKEGYVGVTKNTLSKREAQHRLAAKTGDFIFHKAIRKYGESIVFSVVLISSMDRCLSVEKGLRPNPYTGWNMAAGGNTPTYTSPRKPLSEDVKRKISESQSNNRDFFAEQARRVHTGRKRSAATRKKISTSLTGRKHSEDSKRKMSERRSERLMWESSNSDKMLWLQADVLFDVWLSNGKCGRKTLASLTNFTIYQLTVIQKNFRDGWNPLEDVDWINFKQTHKEN